MAEASAPAPEPDPPPKKKKKTALLGVVLLLGLLLAGGGLLLCGGGGGLLAVLVSSPDVEGKWSGACKASYASDPSYTLPLPMDLNLYNQSGENFSGSITVDVSSERMMGDVSGWVESDGELYAFGDLLVSGDRMPVVITGTVTNNAFTGDCSIDISNDGTLMGGSLTLVKTR